MKLSVLKLSGILSVILIAFVTGCIEPTEMYDPYEQIQTEIKIIDEYLEDEGITNVIRDANGVRMVISQFGTGLPANINNKVKVDYVGNVLRETTSFDNGTIDIALRSVIPGWQIALTTLPVGSKGKIYIPSPLGYGNQAQSKIPPNSILVFDIDFKEVILSETEKQRFTSDTTAIDAYITQKNIANVEIDELSKVRYVISQPGVGATPALYDKVKIKLDYKLLTKDTEVVASVTREPTTGFDSRVVDNIPGIISVLQKLKEGSKATLYIPSLHGFNADDVRDTNGSVIIPANSNLIVEIQVLDFL